MFVITADQVDSRSRPDIVGETLSRLNEEHAVRLVLPVDRNAGDELQVLTDDAGTALAIVLDLTRGGSWSVGLGIGSVRLPLPAETREASGDAFIAAREAVRRAKKAATRFAIDVVVADTAGRANVGWPSAADAEALVNLALVIRERRTVAGWELYDLVSAGLTQADAAAKLGITAPSASSRARAAAVRPELAALPALTRLLENVDRANTRTDPAE
ncbi:DNA-binding protein [Diaminobutyricibacter sp. McL0608]|uniref:DNA-binding protein n=1 Tax=Leifsonia sp. McL0608 TaxID=3143537 RepID=UPI0031F2EE6C